MSLVSVERWGRNALARVMGTIAPLKPLTPEQLRLEWSQGQLKKILLIRPHQGLGDLLLASPIFKALKDSPQKPAVHFLADTYNYIAVDRLPSLDKIWTWDKKAMQNPATAWSFFGALRRERYDLAIIVSSHIPSFTSFLIAWFSGARRVIAFDTFPHYNGANWSRWLAHLALPNLPVDTPEYQKYAALIRPLGLEIVARPEFCLSAEAERWAASEWKKYSFPAGRPVVALFLAGNPDRPERLWPLESWVALAKALQAQQMTLVAIVPPPQFRSGSGAIETGVYEKFSKQLGARLPAFAARELVQVIAFLKHTSLFVCPDGGIFHTAVSAGVPTLGLLFAMDPRCWTIPVSWMSWCAPSDRKAESLTPDVVLKEILRRLQSVSEYKTMPT